MAVSGQLDQVEADIVARGSCTNSAQIESFLDRFDELHFGQCALCTQRSQKRLVVAQKRATRVAVERLIASKELLQNHRGALAGISEFQQSGITSSRSRRHSALPIKKEHSSSKISSLLYFIQNVNVYHQKSKRCSAIRYT